MIDAGLYAGEYPFRRLRDTRGCGLLRLMDEIGCARAIVTAFESVFYKDNLDGLRKVMEETEGVGERVFFYAVINPVFPGWREDMEAALATRGVAGVRLFPMYHHYSPFDEGPLELMAACAEKRVVVNLSHRMVDERLHHWLLRVSPFDLGDLARLLDKCRDTTIVLSHLYFSELPSLKEAVLNHPLAFVDIGNAKPSLLSFERTVREWGSERFLYSSDAPLHYYLNLQMVIEEAQLSAQEKTNVLHNNAARVFGLEEVTGESH